MNEKVKVNFELDSGSGVSTIRQEVAHSCGATVHPTNHSIVGYSGDYVDVFGETYLNIKYNNKSFNNKFLIVNNRRENLFGRDLFLKHDMKITSDSQSNVHEINHTKFQDAKNVILHEFSDYLSENFQSCVKQTVSLNVKPNVQPVFAKARPVPVRLKENVKNELERLIETGTITKVFSNDWSSPTVNVMKDDNTVRICGDFSSTVNQSLDPVQSPLPSIDEVISQVGCAKIFSKIDVSHAFLQVPLDEKSKKFTCINTHDGLYIYNYLPFGLCASPGIFQAFMTKILNGIQGVIIYQDDILIISVDLESHLRTLREVLTALKNAGIKLKLSKCFFFTEKVQYLGHVFNNTGVHPNPDKIRAILDAPAPKNVKQLQAFLGLCNFYKRFIPNFSDVMNPLYSLLKKNVKFDWQNAQQNSFDTVKNLFKSQKVLKLFNPKYETLLETDSSSYGTAAVLMQRVDSNSPWYPIEFASRTLNPSEVNYSNIERECLSVIFGCTKFRKYLLGAPFIIRNDQQPLRKLLAHNQSVPTTCSARLQRWALRLSQFNYRFEYSKGENNVNSDCLSRLPLPDVTHNSEPYELIFAVNELNNVNITCKEISRQTDLDKNLSELKNYIRYGSPSKIDNPNLQCYKKYLNEMSIMKNCILFRNRVLIPPTLRDTVMQQFHLDHPGIVAMKNLCRSIVWFPNIDKFIEDLVNKCDKCQAVRPRPAKDKYVEWPIPPRPWSRVHIDHFFTGNNVCLIAVDALSRYIEVEIVKNTGSEETIAALSAIFSRNGLCDTIVSDNATSFTSRDFQSFLEMLEHQHL